MCFTVLLLDGWITTGNSAANARRISLSEIHGVISFNAAAVLHINRIFFEYKAPHFFASLCQQFSSL